MSDKETGMTTTDAAPGLATMQAHGTEIRQALAILREAKEFSDLLANSQFIPQAYRGKPGDVMACLLCGQSIGLGPMQALQGIAVINGRPSVWGDMALAVVMSHPEFEDINEVLDQRTESEESYAATCTIKRKGRSPVVRRYSVADAKKAGLWNKQGPWQSSPKRMLQMRARGFAQRDAFPDALAGMMLREEAEDVIDITPEAMRDTAPEGRRIRLAPKATNGEAAPAPETTLAGEIAAAEAEADAVRAAHAAKPAEKPKEPDKGNPGKERVFDAPCPGCGGTENVWTAFRRTDRGDLLCANDHGDKETVRFFRQAEEPPAADNSTTAEREPGEEG